jgi:hypothetical protein
VTIFWVKSSIILWKLAKILFSGTSKLKYVQFCEICGYIKRYDIKFFLSLSFVANFGCGIRDPGVKIIRNEKMNVYLKKMYLQINPDRMC